MGGKTKLVDDALEYLFRTLTPEEAVRVSRTGVSPDQFKPYISNWRGTETSYYNPEYWRTVPDTMEDDAGKVIATREKLDAIVPHKWADEVIKQDPELMYRGMSADELADILLRRQIQSRGEYNFDNQKGLTYFTSDPASADSYANSFAPTEHKPNMERPAYIVAAKRPAPDAITNVGGVATHEIGVNRPTPISDLVNIYRGKTTAFDPGVQEKGIYVAPQSRLHWEEKSLEDIFKGRASGGSVREGYQTKGRVVGDVVDQALKLVMGEGDEAAKAGIRAYHVSPHDFDRFDLSKIGTGEGNQAYGHGLYFAESPKVSGRGGEYWRQFHNKMKSGPEQSAASVLSANKFNSEKAAAQLESMIRYHADRSKPGSYGDGPEVELGHKLLADDYQKALEMLQSGQIVGPRTYEVEISADPRSMLDWDKPVADQAPEVLRGLGFHTSNEIAALQAEKAALQKKLDEGGWNLPSDTSSFHNFWDSVYFDVDRLGPDYNRLRKVDADIARATGNVPDISGGQIYRNLSAGNPRNLSATLNDNGVSGIRYLDGMSRSRGDGTRNYVIFDDKLIDIKDKYAEGGQVERKEYGPGGIIDDVVRLAGKVVSGEGDEAAQAGIRAYHGSPHDFDKFSMDKIGTGEGAQAYGHGLYFAEHEPVALGYRRALSGPESMGTVTFDGRPLVSEGTPAEGWDAPEFDLGNGIHARDLAETMLRHNGNADSAISEFRNRSQSGLERAQTIKNENLRQMAINSSKSASDMADFLQANRDRYGVKVPGHMYEVNINANPEHFLDWDKPLSEQPGFLKSLTNYDPDYNVDYEEKLGKVFQSLQPVSEPLGQDFYAELARGNKKGAASMLSKLGVPGIKYLDAGSRGAGDGTRNYVVFDDKLISIIRKYGIAGASAMVGYDLMENLDPKQALAATMANKEYQERDAKADGGQVREGYQTKGRVVGDVVEQALKLLPGSEDAAEAAIRYANEIPIHLREGYKINADPAASADTKQFVNYLNTREHLPFDAESRAARRQDLGYNVDAYHGSPRNIEKFSNRYSTPEGYWGGHHYFTSNPLDASANYATPSGPDLYNRIEREAENVLDNYSDEDVLNWYEGKHGSLEGIDPEDQDILNDYSGDIARDVLGVTNEGAVYPVNLRMKNPVRIDSPNQTFWDYNVDFSDDGDVLSESGKAIDLINKTRDVLSEYYLHPRDIDDVIAKIGEAMSDSGGIDAKTYNDIIRGQHIGAYDDNGNLVSGGHIMSDVFQRMGHDSVDMPTDVFAGGIGRVGMPGTGANTRHYIIFDPKNIRSRFAAFDPFKAASERISDARGGRVDDNDIHDALRVAKDVGGETSSPVMMEDAKGNKYDAQGNIIPPTAPGPNPQRTPTPQEVGQRAAQDPATFDAMMERYAVPDRDIADYKSTRAAVQQQPQQIQQMTHVGAKPRREMTINMPMFGGEYSMGTAPYDVASGLQGMAQGAYDFKTAPAYFFPPTAPFAFGADLLESRMADDPVGLALNLALTPQGASVAKSAGRTVMDVFRQNPKTIGAAMGAGAATVASDEAEAGPARWFSKAVEAARAIPMNKMTGEQALAMLRKGTSPEELRWMGADDFLTGQKSVSKDDLVAFLEKNRVQPKEIVLGGGDKPTKLENIDVTDIPAEIRDRHPEVYRLSDKVEKLRDELVRLRSMPDQSGLDYYDNFRAVSQEFSTSKAELMRVKEALKKEYVESIGGLGRPTKFGPDTVHGETLTTPGGKTYSENLYALPKKDIYTPFVDQMRKDVWAENYKEAIEGGFTEERARKFADKFNNLKPHELAKFLNKEDELESVFQAQKSYEPQYKGGHWSDVSPDVLFHTRTNELVYEPPGANRPYRVHNVEETQSDPGQAGRKIGFKDQRAMAEVARLRQETQELRAKQKSEQERLYAEHQARIAPYVEDRVRYERELRDKYKKGEISLGDMNRLAEAYTVHEPELAGQYRAATEQIIKPLLDKIAANESKIESLGKNIGDIPMMPYVTSTESWTDRAIKQELDRALDKGFDYFSWTPGKTHIERYDLEKHISKIEYNPDDGSLMVYNPNGKMVVNESIGDPSELDEYVGKELADKIRAEERSRSDSIDDAYEVYKDEETGEWTVSIYGDQSYDYSGNPLVFDSKGEAKDYLNQMKADDYASNPVSLSGLDLKVGGEGMRKYYDSMYLKRVQEVIRKATGEKPVIETIEVQTADGPRKQLGVRLTDEMREKARFSDFKKGGRVTGGNAYDSNHTVANALALTREY